MLKKENLRKNFLRVKQIADQNLGRAEKTEALTDDLAQIEKRIELIKTVSLNTHKKISGCLQATGVDVEKRLKKIPVTALSCSMIESSTLLGESLIGTLFQICGDMEGSLGKEVLTHELEVESNVLTPLQNITENDIPNIMKLKKQLNRLVLDMDSARARYHQSLRQSTIPGKENKTDLIKDELEDASMKVEQCRDALATEMYQFFSQETEYGKIALSYAEAQARYHRHSLEVLESVLPKLRSEITQYAHKPVYGTSLEDHLQSTEREIAVVLEECVCTLIDVGLEEEGLFRVAGGASKVKKLKAALDAGVVDLDEFIRDPHVVAGALKLYFRELPEPLMTYSLYSEWMQAAKLPNDQRLQALWTVADQLPKYNYNNLRYLIKFLNKLAEHSDTNKMSSSNIAIVMGPNLIWSEKDGGPNMLTTGTQSAIIDTFITHADWFFPGAVKFSVVKSQSMPTFSSTRFHSPPRKRTNANKQQPSPKPKCRTSKSKQSASNDVASNVGITDKQSNEDRHGTATPVNGKNGTTKDDDDISSPEDRESLRDKLLHRQDSLRKCREEFYMNSTDALDNVPYAAPRKDWKSISLERRQDNRMTRSDYGATSSSTSALSYPMMRAASLESVTSPTSEKIVCNCDGGSHKDSASSFHTPPLTRIERSFPRYSPPPPPPIHLHSDIYNTAFALQSLGDGWSDYLSKVRNITEGHMNKRSSFGDGSQSTKSGEIEFSSEPMCMSHSFTGGSSPCMGQRSSLNNSPVSGSPSLAPRSPSDHNVPAVAAAIDSPSGGKRSPKLNRRVTKTKKGLAPPPPQIQHSSDQHTSVPNSSTDSGSDLETTSTSPDRPVSDHLDRPVPPANKPCYSPRTSYTETNPPPIPERPSQPPPGPPVAHAPPSVVPHPALPISPKERKGSTGGGHRPTRPGPPPPPPPRSDEQKPEIDEETKL